jgi:uncharacterized protein YxeA
MKKARVVLTAIAILTVIGSALAFKSARFVPRNLFVKYTSANSWTTTNATYPYNVALTTTTTIPTTAISTIYSRTFYRFSAGTYQLVPYAYLATAL